MQTTFKKRLQNKETLVGVLLSLPSPEIAEIMTLSGFDWLFIDLEHGPMDFLACQRMIQAAGGQSECLVRVPENSESAIKKALDIGAAGIIAPKVNSAEEAQNIVSYAKYAPQGQRGVGAARAQGYGLHFSEYVGRANEDLLVVIQIEHIEGVNDIDKIVAVPGIDVIFIGPYDLSASMGLDGQVDHPRVLEAIDRVEQACAKHNLPMGYFGMSPEAVKPYRDKGYQLITCGTDAGFLASGASETIKALR